MKKAFNTKILTAMLFGAVLVSSVSLGGCETAQRVEISSETKASETVSEPSQAENSTEIESSQAESSQAESSQAESAKAYTWAVEPDISCDDIGILYHSQPKKDEYGMTEYYSIGQYAYQEYTPIKINEKWGLASFSGEIVLPAEYDMMRVANDRIIAQNGIYYYYIDESNGSFNTVQDDMAQLELGTGGVHPLMWADNTSVLYALNENAPLGESRPAAAILGSYDGVVPTADMSSGAYRYVIVKNRQKVSSSVYDDAGNFSEGIVPVKKDGFWGYVDENDSTVIPFEYDGGFNKDAVSGKTTQPTAFNASCGTVILCKNNQYALYSVEGDVMIPFGELEQIRPVYNEKAWAKLGGKWGVIELTGSAEGSEADSSMPDEESESDSDTAQLIDAIISNESMWSANRGENTMDIRFVDLDLDGAVEFLVQRYGNGTFHQTTAYTCENGALVEITPEDPSFKLQAESLKILDDDGTPKMYCSLRVGGVISTIQDYELIYDQAAATFRFIPADDVSQRTNYNLSTDKTNAADYLAMSNEQKQDELLRLAASFVYDEI